MQVQLHNVSISLVTNHHWNGDYDKKEFVEGVERGRVLMQLIKLMMVLFQGGGDLIPKHFNSKCVMNKWTS